MAEIIGNNTSEFLFGTSDDDVILGNGGNDIIFGFGGDDFIDGGAGNDILFGGSGDDEVHGGEGNDIIFGGSGSDEIYGGDGDDIAFGGSGDDVMDGGEGNDILFGGSGNDTIHGDAGADLILGGFGNDELHGGDGDDRIRGGFGDDSVYGGSGDDGIAGGFGNDELHGGDGDDRIRGGFGDDVIRGGAGADNLGGGFGADTFDYGAFGGGGVEWTETGIGECFIATAAQDIYVYTELSSSTIPDKVESYGSNDIVDISQAIAQYGFTDGQTVFENNLVFCEYEDNGITNTYVEFQSPLTEEKFGIITFEGMTAAEMSREHWFFGLPGDPVKELGGPNEGGDVIVDFEVGDDTLDLSELVESFGPGADPFDHLAFIGNGNGDTEVFVEGSTEAYITLNNVDENELLASGSVVFA